MSSNGSAPGKRFRAAGLVALCAAVLSGCMAGVTGGTGGTHDGRMDALGQRVVADLKTQPTVSDASYYAANNLDQGQVLSISVVVHTNHTDAESTQPLIDLAFKDAWQTPKDAWLAPTGVGTVSVEVHAESNPGGDTIAGDDLHLPPVPQDFPDQKELDSKLTSQYGPYR